MMQPSAWQKPLNNFIRVANLNQMLSKKQFSIYLSLVAILNHFAFNDIIRDLTIDPIIN